MIYNITPKEKGLQEIVDNCFSRCRTFVVTFCFFKMPIRLLQMKQIHKLYFKLLIQVPTPGALPPFFTTNVYFLPYSIAAGYAFPTTMNNIAPIMYFSANLLNKILQDTFPNATDSCFYFCFHN